MLRYIPSQWPKPHLTSWIGKGFAPSNASSEIYTLIRSATNETLGTYECADDSLIDHAIGHAKQAQQNWARKAPIERGRILLEASRLLKQKNKELATLEALTTSRPIAETMIVDIQSAADCLEYFGGSVATQQIGETHDFVNGSFIYTRREPLGVTAGIGAFNYPIQSAAWKIAPALAFGNAIVFKPAEDTPWTAIALAETLKEAGLPDGLLSVVLGTGKVGARLVTDQRISKISFTGSVQTGSKIAAITAGDLKKSTLELGGKSPFIVFEDADIEKAVNCALLANFYSNGEVCSNGTRIFVHEKIHDAFLERLVTRVKKLRIGDPMDPNTDVGPLISEKHLQKILDQLEQAKSENVKVECGGHRITDPKSFHNFSDPKLLKGAFLQPCVFSNVEDHHYIAKTEVFAPVAAVLRFKSEDEVIQRANNTEFGLAAGIFTKDLARGHRVIHQIQAGQCWINHFNLAPVEVPWGGYKKSGFGRENGTEAIHYWTQVKTIHVETSAAGVPDPYPHAT